MVGNPSQHICQPGAGVEIVQLGCDDQRVHRRSTFPAAIGAREQPSLSPQRDATQRALGGIVRQADAAIAEEPAERLPRFSM